MLVFVRSFVDAKEFFSLRRQLLKDLVTKQKFKLSIPQLCAKIGLLGEIHGWLYLNLRVLGLRNVHVFLLLFFDCVNFLVTGNSQVFFQTFDDIDLLFLSHQDLIDWPHLCCKVFALLFNDKLVCRPLIVDTMIIPCYILLLWGRLLRNSLYELHLKLFNHFNYEFACLIFVHFYLCI